MINITKTLNDNVANLPDGLYFETRCNFLHRYFRCLLPLETVDVEEKVKTMRGIHTFRGDRTTQVIPCNPWSTRLCPYPSLIRKMKTYLEVEGKLGAKPNPQPKLQPCTSTLSQNNSLMRKTLVPKKAEKMRTARALVNRRYKVRVIAQPLPTTQHQLWLWIQSHLLSLPPQ